MVLFDIPIDRTTGRQGWGMGMLLIVASFIALTQA